MTYYHTTFVLVSLYTMVIDLKYDNFFVYVTVPSELWHSSTLCPFFLYNVEILTSMTHVACSYFPITIFFHVHISVIKWLMMKVYFHHVSASLLLFVYALLLQLLIQHPPANIFHNNILTPRFIKIITCQSKHPKTFDFRRVCNP